MLRHSSPLERVLTYATFLTLSLAVHMIVVLGTRPEAGASPEGGVAATSTQTAFAFDARSAGSGGVAR